MQSFQRGLSGMALAEETKAYSKCGHRLPLAAFYALRRGLLGHRPECKSCHNTYHNTMTRRRYIPKTGRRYLTRGDRAAAAAEGPDAAP
jgi:hypothetical protein